MFELAPCDAKNELVRVPAERTMTELPERSVSELSDAAARGLNIASAALTQAHLGSTNRKGQIQVIHFSNEAHQRR